VFYFQTYNPYTNPVASSGLEKIANISLARLYYEEVGRECIEKDFESRNYENLCFQPFILGQDALAETWRTGSVIFG
jgi:hypothetical protein